MSNEKLSPIHPGEVLLEEFLKPMNLSQDQLASAILISVDSINKIISGKQEIDANTALRLARYFNMSPRFWLGLQMDYDLDMTEDQIGEQLQQEVSVLTR
ncbi:MAG: HigA family addiction module antitoxin [Synechocystis sp.]